MSRFRIIEEDKATEEVKDIYKTIRRELGFSFVPNLFKSMAASPAVLRGNWENVRFTFLSGTVPRTIKEMICVAVSSANRNNYCLKMHIHGLSILGVDKKILQGLQGKLDELPLPERTKVIIRFALKIALEPTSVTHKDFSELKDEGLTEEEILEIVSTANLISLLNVYAELAGVDLDECYV